MLTSRAMLLCCGFYLASDAAAQKLKRVEYYRSPFKFEVQIDPLGLLLGRIGARYEWRLDPLYSSYIEVARHGKSLVGYQKSLSAIDAAFGYRIYLRDNAAMEGLFAGVALGPTYVKPDIGARLSLELGYKWRPEGTRIFIEPELLIDNFILLTHHEFRPVVPLIAIPIGFMF